MLVAVLVPEDIQVRWELLDWVVVAKVATNMVADQQEQSTPVVVVVVEEHLQQMGSMVVLEL
jgi:hypothetical protein